MTTMNGERPQVRSFSLFELVTSVRKCLEAGFGGYYWVRAETSDVRRSGGQGHCYMELLEKSSGEQVRARIRASIWAATHVQIDQKLKAVGLASLASGMNVLALVQVAYHEQYGLSLNIIDIDPNYSLGEIARLRQETIARLRRENIFEDNRSLSLEQPVQRLAVISSATAAGYGDFMNQLRNNRYGLQFYVALFAAQMQGERTSESVVAALGRIHRYLERFDAVVIIRGGGAVSELRAFDSYELCAACAQFPLPVLCGIGHERDESVLDLVAHTSLKTPTAVAEYLVHRMLQEYQTTLQCSQRLRQSLAQYTLETHRMFDLLSMRLPAVAGQALQQEQRTQQQLRARVTQSVRLGLHREHQRVDRSLPLLRYMSSAAVARQREFVDQMSVRLMPSLRMHLARYEADLSRYEQAVRLANPEGILRRGFALVYREEKILTDATQLTTGDRIRLHLGASQALAEVQ